MSIIGIIILLIFVGVALYLVQVIPMDATVKVVIRVLVIAATILWLLFNLFPGSHAGMPPINLR